MRVTAAVTYVAADRARWAITVPTVTLVASAASATATIRSSSTDGESPCHLHEWHAINASELVAKPVAAEADHLSCGLTILVQAVAPWSSIVTGWALLNWGGGAQPAFGPLEIVTTATLATNWDSYAIDFADVDRDGVIDGAVLAGESSGHAQVEQYANLNDLFDQTNAEFIGAATGIGAIDAVMLGGRGVTLVALADQAGTYRANYDGSNQNLTLNTGYLGGAYAWHPVFDSDALEVGFFELIYGSGLTYFRDDGRTPYSVLMNGASYSFTTNDDIGVADFDHDGVGEVWFFDRDANAFWVFQAAINVVDLELVLDYASDLTALFDTIDVVGLANGQPDEVMIHDVDADGDDDLLIGAGPQITVYELFDA